MPYMIRGGSLYLPLWDVEHGGWWGLVQLATVNRPQATEDAEQGALATAIGA